MSNSFLNTHASSLTCALAPFAAPAALSGKNPAPARDKMGQTTAPLDPWTGVAYAASTAGVAVGAYHGYKRNDSVGWAIVWALLGGLAPIIVIPVALAQGIGTRKKG